MPHIHGSIVIQRSDNIVNGNSIETDTHTHTHTHTEWELIDDDDRHH